MYRGGFNRQVGRMTLEFRGLTVSRGRGLGEALVSHKPITFFGGVDPKTGLIIEDNHPLKGRSLRGRVLIMPRGKGSTVGSWVLYELSLNKLAPSAIVSLETDAILAVGAIIARVPMICRLDADPSKVVNDGDLLEVVAEGRMGLLKVLKKGANL